jgi:DnaJ-domain-containing protein 1
MAPIGALVTGAMYFEKEMMEMPEEYKSLAKQVLGARPESVPDYYSIIGVRRGADTGEIKKAFRELSKVYHPDKTAGNTELQVCVCVCVCDCVCVS